MGREGETEGGEREERGGGEERNRKRVRDRGRGERERVRKRKRRGKEGGRENKIAYSTPLLNNKLHRTAFVWLCRTNQLSRDFKSAVQ